MLFPDARTDEGDGIAHRLHRQRLVLVHVHVERFLEPGYQFHALNRLRAQA